MQINNGNENIEISAKLAKKLTKNDLNAGETETVNKAIFESIDKNKDGELTTDELADMLSKLDADGDGTVTDAEITNAVNKIENVKAEKKTEYINFLKNMAAKNAEKIANDNNVGNSYVVQLGEQFPDLIKRIMKAQGEKDEDITESSDVYKKYVAQFKADNPNAFKAKEGGDGVHWLYAGSKVYIRTDSQNTEKAYIKDRANVSEVEEDYRNWIAGGKKAFTYNAEKPNAYRETQGADAKEELGTAEVDFSKFDDDDYGALNKDKVQEQINKAVEIINKLKDKSNIEKTTPSDKKVAITLKDGTGVIITYNNDNQIQTIWVDTDGAKGGLGEVGFKPDGTILLNTDKNKDVEHTMKKDGAFDFDKLKELCNAGISENSDSEFDETDKKTNYVLRFNMNIESGITGGSKGSVSVIAPDGTKYTATANDKHKDRNKLLDSLCEELKTALSNNGWTNITLVNPHVKSDGNNYKKAANSTDNIDKTKAYTTYVAFDASAKVASIHYPDGSYQKYENIDGDPTKNQSITDDIKHRGWTNLKLVKSDA